jgi:hypothetical protein
MAVGVIGTEEVPSMRHIRSSLRRLRLRARLERTLLFSNERTEMKGKKKIITGASIVIFGTLDELLIRAKLRVDRAGVCDDELDAYA